jgi:hypothetical protein
MARGELNAIPVATLVKAAHDARTSSWARSLTLQALSRIFDPLTEVSSGLVEREALLPLLQRRARRAALLPAPPVGISELVEEIERDSELHRILIVARETNLGVAYLYLSADAEYVLGCVSKYYE